MDSALQLRHPLWEVQQLIMKQFVVLLAFVSPLVLAEVKTSYETQGGALAAAPVAVAQRVSTAPPCNTCDTVTSQEIILPTLKSNSSIDTKTFEWYSHWF